MTEFEMIREFERDGWQITVALAPDYDYQPGVDDDLYPRFEEVGYHGDDTEERGHDGRFLPQPIIVTGRQGMLKVTPEEIDRLTEISGGNPRRMRRWIAETAAAIAGEDLTWAVVRVTASRGEVRGSDCLGSVEYDLREREPERYALDTVEHYGMVENAIEDAARSAVGNLAPLALSY